MNAPSAWGASLPFFGLEEREDVHSTGDERMLFFRIALYVSSDKCASSSFFEEGFTFPVSNPSNLTGPLTHSQIAGR